MKIREDAIAAWHDGSLVIGVKGKEWNDAYTLLFDGEIAHELAAGYEVAGRMGYVDDDGLIALLPSHPQARDD